MVHESAIVEEGVDLGEGTRIWHRAQVRTGARIGRHCVIGGGAFVDTGVVMGDGCKIQNNVLLYAPAVLGPGVFLGPGVIITNDRVPRAVNPDGSVKDGADWQPSGVTVGQGAAVGAGAVVVAGCTIGDWALIGAGTVVTADVAPFALVVGNPGRRIGWVGRTGRRLVRDGDGWRCDATGEQFAEVGDRREPIS